VDKIGLHTPVPKNDCSTCCWAAWHLYFLNPFLTGSKGVDKFGLHTGSTKRLQHMLFGSLATVFLTLPKQVAMVWIKLA
jgi:hypothetical protein